ncbi:MAG: carboxymuconolactone decarboxylase family protein [Carboxydocellales bacterium]
MSRFVPPFIKILEEKDPTLYATVTELMEKAMAPGALDAKTKVLITLALDAHKEAEGGVTVLSRQARELGASEEEIAETLRLAYYVAGMGVLAASSVAWKKES